MGGKATREPRRIGPPVAVLGLGVALVVALFWTAIWLKEAIRPGLVHSFEPYHYLLVATVTLPLLVVIYGPLRERTGGIEAVKVGVETLRQRYTATLGAVVLAGATAVVLGALLLGVLVAFETVLRWTGVSDVLGIPPLGSVGLIYALLAVGSLAVGTVPVRFADVIATTGATPREACWRSIAAVVHRPLPALVESGLAGVLGVGALTVTAGVASVLPPYFVRPIDSVRPDWWFLAPLIGVVVLGAIVVAFAVTHWIVYERWLRPVISPPPAVPIGRIAMVGVIVALVLAGGTAIRIADPGGGQASLEALPEDPGEAYRVAVENTRASNRWVVWTNDSTGRIEQRVGIEYDAGRLLEYEYGEGESTGRFLGAGILATREFDTDGDRTVSASGDGQWSSSPVPGYRTRARPASTRAMTLIDPSAVDPRVVTANETDIVYRVRTETMVVVERDNRSPSLWDRGETVPVTVEVVVDRPAGVIDRLSIRYRDPAVARGPYTVEYDSVRTATVDRPDGLGVRGPTDWFWDVVYYRSDHSVER
ncbi:MAG: hypothetical protein ACOCYZ_03015 [Halococcoides sp.]